jgi:hypothetical protein
MCWCANDECGNVKLDKCENAKMKVEGDFLCASKRFHIGMRHKGATQPCLTQSGRQDDAMKNNCL